MPRGATLSLICSVSMLLTGCSSNSGGGTTAVGYVTRLNGFVAGATVRAGSSSTTTDSSGRFELSIPSDGATVLSFTMEGYAPAYLSVEPRGVSLVTVSAVLAEVTQTTTVDVRQGPQTVALGEVELTFPQGSIQTTSSGTPPDGPVTVALTWLPRSDAGALSPVPLTGTDGSETHPLTALGMLDVSLSFNGDPCQLVSGKPMGLSLPAQTTDPATAGLFSVDPERAIWVLEGEATNSGGRWTAEIPHLSWWNIDLFNKVPTGECACLRFVARTPAGDPVPGVTIRSMPSATYSFGGWTDADGTLCHPCFPTGEMLAVQWSAILALGATAGVGDVMNVTPTATGATCGSPACQDVAITVSCTSDAQCGPGKTCLEGSCGKGGDTQPPGGLLGSCDVTAIGMCHQFNDPQMSEADARTVCDQQAVAASFKPGVPCPTSNLVGSCTYNKGGAGEAQVYYYSSHFGAAAAMLQSTCVQGGGVWQ